MEPIAAATADWRAQVPPSARQWVVDKIEEILLSRLLISEPERCKEIQRIAVRFEEQIFTIATSQSDYLKKVCLKLFSIELKTQHAPLTNSAVTDAAAVPESSIYPAHGIQSQVSCDMLLAHQASASFFQPHGADDQQRLIMWSQTSLPEVSLNAWVGSTVENEHADGIDWQQETYEKVQSANPEALRCAVNAIGSVVTMIDGMASSAPLRGSRGALGEDLAVVTNGSLRGRSFMLMDGNTAARKMKRDIDAMSLNNVSFVVGGANDGFVQSDSPDASELVSTMKSHDKRKKSKVNHAPTEKYDQKNRGGSFDSSDAVWEHCVGA